MGRGTSLSLSLSRVFFEKKKSRAPERTRDRSSRTRIRHLATLDDGTSVVECSPLTGRTHQIRLHLQWLGHPIANDPCYGGTLPDGDGDDSQPRGAAPAAEPTEYDAEPRHDGEDDADLARRKCLRCRAPPHVGKHAKCIWLHALRYTGPGWSYETDLPDWAKHTNSPP